MKAFLVDCDGEYGAQIYFAATRGQAKAMAANDENTDITGIVSCKRAPEYDEYSPGPIPIHVLLDAGWWFECCGCGRQVYNNEEHWHFNEPCEEPTLVIGQSVYCCQSCKDTADAAEAKRKLEEIERRRAARRAFSIQWPEVTPCRVDVIGRRQPLIGFRIPGAGSEIIWAVGDATVQVLPTDIAAWHAWEDSRRGAVMAWEDEGGALPNR